MKTIREIITYKNRGMKSKAKELVIISALLDDHRRVDHGFKPNPVARGWGRTLCGEAQLAITKVTTTKLKRHNPVV